jgi:hypothetical protein
VGPASDIIGSKTWFLDAACIFKIGRHRTTVNASPCHEVINMPSLLGAIACLLLWIVFGLLFPLGPAGAAIHMLLGLSGALVVRWWALRPTS